MIWFSIEEKKPENGTFCAVMVGSDGIFCEYDDDMFFDLASDDIFMSDEIDLWCYVPEPPEIDFDDEDDDDFGDDDSLKFDEDGLHINNAKKFEDLEPEPIQVIFIKNSRVFNDGLAIFQFNMN